MKNLHPCRSALLLPMLAAGVCTLAACGQTGPLYLPDQARDVVTRPASPPPEADAPNSPRTPDAPVEPPSPAPEVTPPPDGNDPGKSEVDDTKKPGTTPKS